MTNIPHLKETRYKNTLFVTTIDGHLLKAETDRIGVEYNRN